MNRHELAEVFKRLGVLYSQPRGADLAAEAFVGEWLRALGHFTPADVQKAVDAYASSSRRWWPRPGELARWLRKHAPAESRIGTPEREYLAWERDWGRRDVPGPGGAEVATYGGCPVCGAEPIFRGRFRVEHRARVHRSRGLPTIGWSDEIEAYYAGNRAGPRDPLDEGVS